MFGVESLTPEIFSVLVIIFLTLTLFVVEIVRVDVVACLILVLLGITNLVPENLFSGFSSDAVISLIGIMIIGRGLERTGVINGITRWILRIGGDNEPKIRLLLMGIGGFLAGFMRSVGTVALFLPVVTRIRRTTGIAKANLLLPMGFCAILGSVLTMVGSGPLILLNSLLEDLGSLTDATGNPVPPLGLFSVFPIGLGLLAVGILYFTFFGKWLLPNLPKRSTSLGDSMAYFKRIYGVGGDIFEVKVPATSSLKDNTLNQWEALLDPEIAIIGIKTDNKMHMPPLRTDDIKTSSTVALLGPKGKVTKFVEKFGLKLSSNLNVFKEALNPLTSGLCEAVVPPSSSLVGRDFKELHMRRHYSAQVLAVLRGDKVTKGSELRDLNLRPGDTMGMFCNWEVISDFEASPDFVVVTTDYPHEHFFSDKAHTALLFTFLTATLLIATPVEAPLCLLLGAVGMVFTKVLSIDEAYEAVSWKTIFLLAGLLPLGIAVKETGTAAWITEHFLSLFSTMPVIGIEIILAVLAAVFSLLMSNVGATILMVPMAVDLATTLHQDPRMFALLIVINTSNAFILPTHQANALISGPGRYKVIDFVKTGVPLTILFIATTIIGLNLIF